MDKMYFIRGTELDGTHWFSYRMSARGLMEQTIMDFAHKAHIIPTTHKLELMDDDGTIYMMMLINEGVADDPDSVL